MSIIIYDLLCSQPNGKVKFHGGGEYAKTVFKALVEYAADSCSIEVCYNTEAFIDEWIKAIIRERTLAVHAVKDAKDVVDVLNAAVKRGNVRFFTGMVYPYKRGAVDFPENITAIGTCHGLRTLEKPYDKYWYNYFGFKGKIKCFLKNTVFKNYLFNKRRNDYERSIENFDIIATDSKHSEYAIKVFLSRKIRDSQIKVLYLPLTYHPEPDKKETTNEKFIMMINANRWEKNSYRGICALDDLYKKGYLRDVKTYVYGNYPSGLKKRIKNQDKFQFFGYVDGEELEAAYRFCEIFFYPTLNEGFGLPPLEAMKYGKTCAISAVCSLTEVYGDFVYYFNPYDIQEMENRILMALENKISEEKIRERCVRIYERQKKDLKELCRLICG